MRKDHHKRKTKMNIPVRAAAVLLCLTLASTYFVSGLFARYSTSDQSGGNARVARFSFNGGIGENIGGKMILSQLIEADLIPGGSEEVPLIIENNSEVAVEYTIDVTNETNNLPLQLSIGDKTGSSVTSPAQGSDVVPINSVASTNSATSAGSTALTNSAASANSATPTNSAVSANSATSISSAVSINSATPTNSATSANSAAPTNGVAPTNGATPISSDTRSVQQAPGSHYDKYTLHINWPEQENKDDDLARMGMVDYIKVTVTATQID